jgi:hypothetical protein
MSKYVVGFIAGVIIGAVATAYAASAFRWVNGSGEAVGTSGNPVYVVSV